MSCISTRMKPLLFHSICSNELCFGPKPFWLDPSRPDRMHTFYGMHSPFYFIFFMGVSFLLFHSCTLRTSAFRDWRSGKWALAVEQQLRQLLSVQISVATDRASKTASRVFVEWSENTRLHGETTSCQIALSPASSAMYFGAVI